MPSWPAVLALAAAATLLWTLIGWPLARRILPEPLPAAAFSPLLGWCVHTPVAMAVLPHTGFTRLATAGVAATLLAAVWAMHLTTQGATTNTRLPRRAIVLCAVVACLPAAAILPQHEADGIRLAAPIFDHSKIAMIDAMTRQGLPPINPFYGGYDVGPHLAYYWWWHGSAAELARLAHVSGWTSDAALTWFTAYATLMLMAGLGSALGAPLVTVLLAIPASLRPFTAPLEHAGLLQRATGLGGWLNQVTWAPQHVASAGALVLSILILARSQQANSRLAVAGLACTVAAGFGASTWVGGIVCALALPSSMLVFCLPMHGLKSWIAHMMSAAALALVLIVPLIRDQLAMHRDFPLAFQIYQSLGVSTSWLNLVAFPVLLLIEFPVVALLAAPAIPHVWRTAPSWQRALIATALAGLAITLTLRSTIENNDLGWRAAIPALLVLTPMAAATASRWWRTSAPKTLLVATAVLLGLAGAWPLIRNDTVGRSAPGAAFSQIATAWQHAGQLTNPAARIASDPRLTATMTPWPANIAWALMADRSSCYAGWATAHPFAPVSNAALYQTDLMLRRIFDGVPRPSDLANLVDQLRCHAILLTPQSPAWSSDPFTAWHLLGSGANWRVYQEP